MNKEFKVLLFLIYILIPLIFKMKSSHTSLYLIFGFLSVLLGFLIHLYKTVTWYDTFVHFIWGIVSSLLAIIVLKFLKIYDGKKVLFNVLFIISFTIALSCLWEVVEFIIDIVFKSDMQRKITGVYDTMKDIISGILGSILFIIWFAYEYKSDNELLIRKYINIL